MKAPVVFCLRDEARCGFTRRSRGCVRALCAPLGVLKERAFGIEKGGVGSKGGGLEEQWSDAKGSKRTAEPPVNSVGLEVTASRTD